MQWDEKTYEDAKVILRQSESVARACEHLSEIAGEAVTRHVLRHAFKKAGLANPAAYLDGGIEASLAGDHPKHHTVTPAEGDKGWVPPGYMMRGVSTNVGSDGKVRQQWIKTKVDTNQRLEMLRKALESIAEPFRGLADPIQPPKPGAYRKDIMNVIPLGDPHIGLYSWHRETGEDFDLKIAERDLVAAVDYLVEQAPAAETAMLVNLGDFFHSDTMDAKTRRSGHHLDVDGRWPKVLEIGVRIMRRLIEKLAEKHQDVKVINAIGNHDDHTSVMLSVMLSNFYERDDRITIETDPRIHHYHVFGENLIGVTHGHTTKPEQLVGVMATDRREDWGRTQYHYWLTGHVHHDQRKEFAGCIWESFRTLAAPDSYAASYGYRSDRDVKCITYHREYGEIQRLTSNIRLVRALQTG